MDTRKNLDLRFSKQTFSETVFRPEKHLDRANFLRDLLGEHFLKGELGRTLRGEHFFCEEHFEESTIGAQSTLRRALFERRALRGEH